MVRAREYDRDPFDVLDEEIGWDRLVASREEIATLGDLATQDPLSLATQRYAQLRRFAPAFLEAFEFDAPASGQGLPSAATATGPEPASACLAVGMGAHRVDRRLRLELRGRCADQCPSVEPLSRQDPRLAFDAGSDP